MSALEFGVRNGHLDLLDWDLAIVKHICALLDDDKGHYYLPLNGIYIGDDPIEKALVVYKRPEPTQVEMDVPLIVITRDDVAPAPERIYTIAQQYRLPAAGATRVSAAGCLGYSSYEQKEQEQPYDLMYSFEVWSRYRSVAQMLKLMIMTKFPMRRGKIVVTDGIGCERVYAAFLEGTADLTEVNSIVDRLVGFSITVRLEGELTLDRMPEEFPAFTGPQIPADEADPDAPDPGPGGIYTTGRPCITIEVIDDC